MPSTRFTQLTVSQKLTKIFILGKKQLIVHTSDYNILPQIYLSLISKCSILNVFVTFT